LFTYQADKHTQTAKQMPFTDLPIAANCYG